MAILKNKYLVRIVGLNNGEVLFEKGYYDFNKAAKAYMFLKEASKGDPNAEKQDKTYSDHPLELKGCNWDNGLNKYTKDKENDGFVVSVWGYSSDDIMFRISAREYLF